MSKPLSFALLAVVLLGGCAQKPPGPDVDPQARLQFQQAFQAALQHSISSRVLEATAGAVALDIVVNRQGQAVSCKAKGSPEGVAKLPLDVPRTGPREFAAMMEQSCRQAIYPTAPDALYDDKGQIELRAPVVVVFAAQNSAGWKLRNAQREFFREHLLKGESVDSVGQLAVRYQTDARGCLVDLRPNPMRPEDFKLDGGLQARLNQACMKLDLSRLPGIEQAREQQAVAVVGVEYAPWTVGR